MNEPSEHPSTEELLSVYLGEIESERTRELLTHLESCDACFELLERAWALASPVNRPVPRELKGERARRIEDGLFERLHQTKLAEDVTDLGTRGFLAVCLGLMRALLSAFSH